MGLAGFGHVTQNGSHVTSPHHVTQSPGHVLMSSPLPSPGLMSPPVSTVSSASHVSSNHVSQPSHMTSGHVTTPHVISVHAVIRIKPSIAKSSITEFSNSSITISSAQKRTFLYDHIFGPQTTQTEIYAHFANSTDQFVAGYNVTIMAYGQSGSGKSYTMGTESQEAGGGRESRAGSRMSVRSRDHEFDFGDPVNPDPDSEGIVQRASAEVFAKLEQKYGHVSDHTGLGEDPGLGVSLTASYVELYNEQFRDLLDPTPKPQPMVREDNMGNVIVTGVNHVTVHTLTQLLSLLRSGSELRQKGSTALNSESSRSHAIFTLTLTQNGASSKFNFVDLAGSERLKNTEAKGDRVKEGISINGGLAALGKVISQLSNSPSASKHISYRDSKLTRLLQDSLGGKAVTYLLSCITSDEAFVSETLSTLSYTQRARAIQLTPEIVQNEAADFEQVKREMEYWRSRARELERSRDTSSRMSSRDSPSRGSPTRGSRDSPTRMVRDSPRMLPSSPRHKRDWSHDLSHDLGSPDTTFSPRDSTTDVSRASPTLESRENGFSRLNNTTEMHVAIEDMIKQYDLRILGLEEALREEERCHVMSRDTLEGVVAERDAEIQQLRLQLDEKRQNGVSRDRRGSRDEERGESRASESRENVRLREGPTESRESSVASVSRDAVSRDKGASRAPLEARITVLETHLDNSRVQHRRTLDELKRLSSHYEVQSRDLERSRKEVEKEKQLRYDVIAQMKRSSVSESRDEGNGGGRPRTASSFASSLFASLPRVSRDDDTGLGKVEESGDEEVAHLGDVEVTQNGTVALSEPHFH